MAIKYHVEDFYLYIAYETVYYIVEMCNYII